MFRDYLRAGALAIAVIGICLVSACSVHAVRKAPPEPFALPLSGPPVSFNPPPSAVYEVDLGSLLFRKFERTRRPPTIGAAPVGTSNGFPSAEGWMKTWTYTGDDAAGADIVTHPAFYEGSIGVIVGPSGELLTREPVIQVDGKKKGRRWAASGGPTLLKSNDLVSSWALRYGGERDGGHRFMIVDYADDKEREVVQDFRISYEEATKGFSVKGVVVKVRSYGAGKIRYSFEAN